MTEGGGDKPNSTPTSTSCSSDLFSLDVPLDLSEEGAVSRVRLGSILRRSGVGLLSMATSRPLRPLS
jgi:hypothetical protein